jgi:adenosylcobyric acid synthase
MSKIPLFFMVQGTGSDVGKSLIVAGLCRVFARKNYKVMPFKPQNMSNNAAITIEGGEIGKAQALQAKACNMPLTVHMNPILLKPESDGTSQIIVQGQRIGQADFRNYQNKRKFIQNKVNESFEILKSQADIIIIEGAGSPAEVNLRSHDIANMGFAVPHNIPVILVADIDRGGVIASLIGTKNVLNKQDQNQIKGFIINKFRGDIRLFDDGVEFIKQKTGWYHFGTLPYLKEASLLPQEDGFSLEQKQPQSEKKHIKIAIPMLSRISNFDDFDPLRAEPDVSVEFVPPYKPIPICDLIILPGTKSTIADLQFLKSQGWHIDIEAHIRQNKPVLGICGGFQMLGKTLNDPNGYDGTAQSIDGLGYLDIYTTFTNSKKLENWQGIYIKTSDKVKGYHMHLGYSEGKDCQNPMFKNTHDSDGAISPNGLIQGCYIHGLFVEDKFRHSFLNNIKTRQQSSIYFETDIEMYLNHLADRFEEHLDIENFLNL